MGTQLLVACFSVSGRWQMVMKCSLCWTIHWIQITDLATEITNKHARLQQKLAVLTHQSQF